MAMYSRLAPFTEITERRGAGVAEQGCLLSSYTGVEPVSRVRIPPSPPFRRPNDPPVDKLVRPPLCWSRLFQTGKSSNGRKRGSGPRDRGSSPCFPASRGRLHPHSVTHSRGRTYRGLCVPHLRFGFKKLPDGLCRSPSIGNAIRDPHAAEPIAGKLQPGQRPQPIRNGCQPVLVPHFDLRSALLPAIDSR